MATPEQGHFEAPSQPPSITEKGLRHFLKIFMERGNSGAIADGHLDQVVDVIYKYQDTIPESVDESKREHYLLKQVVERLEPRQ